MRFRRHQEAADNATWGLVLGFVAVLLALLVVVNVALALALRLTVPFVNGTPALFFETNTAIVLLFVLGGCWIETLRLREGGAHVARLAGARPAAPGGAAQERRLVNVVQEMALASRMRAPDVWVVPRDHSINAFAAGWTREDAVIAVTQGALDRLTRAELQGLVGHEMGHIVSGDTRLHTRLVGMVWGLQMVHGFGRSLAESDDLGRRRAGAIVGFVLMMVGYAGWLAGRVLQASVARQCEYRADASAVQYSRTVDGIGGVLRKIAGLTPQPRPTPPESLAHLWVADASGFGVFGWRRWLATHPPIALRLARLYGRPVESLDAPLLPTPADEPMMAFAPHGAKASTGSSARFATESPAHAATVQPVVQGAPLAHAFDPQDQRDALQRSTFWRSRGERHGALLAWLIADEGDTAPWPAWRRHLGDAPFVEKLRADWLSLGRAARWQVFDALIAGTLSASAADRMALLLAARGLAPQGAARLRLLLLRHALRGAGRAGRQPLEALAPSFAAATTLIAQAMSARGADWAAAAQAGVTTVQAGTLRSATPQTALKLRRLHAMQRPRVARVWAAAAAKAGLLEDEAATNLLVTACRLLDTPPPQALLGDERGYDRIL